MDLPDLPQMNREHQAWLAFVQQLKLAAPDLDLNQEDALHAAVTLWGEELYRLRLTQETKVADQAYDEHVALYAQHIGFLPYNEAGVT
jgi:hypothetical protein